MYFVYVLKDKNGEYYKGLSVDLERRIRQHKRGEVFSTRGKLPVKLVFVQVCKNRVKARNLEKYLKSGAGREIIRKLIN